MEEQLRADQLDERWNFELGFGLGTREEHTQYLDRLTAFGFKDNGSMPLRASVGLGYRLLSSLVVGLNYYNLDAGSLLREDDQTYTQNQHFSWTGHALNVYVQADISVGRRRLFNLFGRLGLGMSLAWTRFEAMRLDAGFPQQAAALETTGAGLQEVKQNYLRPAGFLGLGVQLMPGRYFGVQGELRWVLADAIQNDFGDKHKLGGFNVIFSVRARSWE